MTPQRPHVVCNWAGTETPCGHPHCECPDALVDVTSKTKRTCPRCDIWHTGPCTIPPLYATQPSLNGVDWYVWNMREALPPKLVFTGTMEDAGLVADALNRRLQQC